MRTLSPVVWREGMHLAQHHFQLRDRYFTDSTAFALESLHHAPYGVSGLELDDEALLNGTVSVVHARGVMPDGLPFSFPDEEGPAPLDVAERFSPTRESHVVVLAVPAFRRDAPNLENGSASGDGGGRYRSESREVPDETTGQDVKEVTVARKNFRLALDDEELDEHVTLPLARVRRDRSGNFVYDEDFIPPCLRIGASDGLVRRLERLVEILREKGATLSADVGKPEAGRELAAPEIVSFWLSHAVHSSLPVLQHQLEARDAHPEELFRSLLRLAGALCTFSMESDPRNLPTYDHEDLESCFDALDRHVRDHLEVALPRSAIRIPLEPAEEYFLEGRVSDRRALDDAHWFLGVETRGSRQEMVSGVPRLAKVCSAKHIRRLVQAAHPGLGLEHDPSPPSAVPSRVSMEFFRIETDGPCWVSIQDTREVGVYAPEALEEAELAIFVVPGG